MVEKHWLDFVTAFGSIATPIIVLIISTLGWKAKNNIERKIDLENKLRDDRIEIYNKILEPFIILLMSDAAWKSDKNNKGKDKNALATSAMLTLEYRRHGFKLALMANDSVVKAYNDLMQYLYNMEEEHKSGNTDFLKDMMQLLGNFLIEIRKSMGNEATELDVWDMCEWWMSDTRKVKNGTYSA
ncbi:hypothetical protein BM607_007750 [Shewanella sp. SACH]|uniref:hypothetical protein n=1 Tax=Shewanella TaxID=22 RepID=UPI0001E4BBDA|nr:MULTISPECIES: hypothetical protein [Shewanella]AEG10985.1 hypothetical protein Sbal175_1709 [Shewanella baltica BA175]OUS53779.1 hypothetical protein BM607_007750 [Shewanella sp. SACH]